VARIKNCKNKIAKKNPAMKAGLSGVPYTGSLVQKATGTGGVTKINL